MRLAAAYVAAALLEACTHREPPAPEGEPSVALPEPAPASSRAIATPPSAANSVPAADSALLPQTRDTPRDSGPAFEARVAALWNAILEDAPERGMPFFFPLGAYEQVKDVGNPAADWKHRLVAAYAHDIHALHARLADAGAHARLVALEVPAQRARWVEPGEEYNKIGYFRVFGSKLRYDDGGEGRTFDVKSLISWRGEWYVVHLSAIK